MIGHLHLRLAVSLNMAGVYAIRNRDTAKLYVGSSYNMYVRICGHRSQLKKNKHGNRHLQASWNKHGERTFEVVVLEKIADRTQLASREQYWMGVYNVTDSQFGYNILPQARSSAGRKLTEEHKKKLSEAHKGKKLSPAHRKRLSEVRQERGTWSRGKTFSAEYRKKLSEAHKGIQAGKKHPLYGKKRSEETTRKISETKKRREAAGLYKESRDRISAPMKGKKHSTESRQKMSEFHKGKKIPEETKRNMSKAQKKRRRVEKAHLKKK